MIDGNRSERQAWCATWNRGNGKIRASIVRVLAWIGGILCVLILLGS